MQTPLNLKLQIRRAHGGGWFVDVERAIRDGKREEITPERKDGTR